MSNDYDNNGTIDSGDINYIITNWNNENFELSDIFNINSQLSDFKIAEFLAKTRKQNVSFFWFNWWKQSSSKNKKVN